MITVDSGSEVLATCSRWRPREHVNVYFKFQVILCFQSCLFLSHANDRAFRAYGSKMKEPANRVTIPRFRSARCPARSRIPNRARFFLGSSPARRRSLLSKFYEWELRLLPNKFRANLAGSGRHMTNLFKKSYKPQIGKILVKLSLKTLIKGISEKVWL